MLETVDRSLKRQPVISPGAIFLVGLILISTYDKSGIVITIGSRSISAGIYKVLFVLLVVLYVLDLFLSPTKKEARVDRGLYRLIVAFIVIQTAASFVGLFVAPGEILLTSEIYYLIQRSCFLMIPLLALRYHLSPQSVLTLFLGAILVHYAFIALQFISSDGYGAFLEYVGDPLREDNMTAWSSETVSLNFVGLQRTGNYGTFGAAFGLLMLAFTPKSMLGRFLKLTVVFLALFMVLVSPSRATFLMTMIALLVFSTQTGLVSKAQTFVVVMVGASIVAMMFMMSSVGFEDVTAIYAFVNPEKGSSNEGKLVILAASPELIAQSPIFGWGQRRFSHITAAKGLDDIVDDYSHSYVLNTILSSGLIGLLAYIAVFVGIARALWRRKEPDYAIVCGMFIGLGLYNIVYDAGHLDLFACFNGVAAYYALRSQVTTPAVQPSAASVPAPSQLLGVPQG